MKIHFEFLNECGPGLEQVLEARINNPKGDKKFWIGKEDGRFYLLNEEQAEHWRETTENVLVEITSSEEEIHDLIISVNVLFDCIENALKRIYEEKIQCGH